MTYLTNKKAAPSAADMAALLGQDNRSVVVSPDPATPGNVVVASALAGEDGDFIGAGPDRENITDVANAFDEGPPPVAAYESVAEANAQVAEVYPSGTLSKDFYRTQYFYENPGQKGGGVGGMKPIDYSVRKLCFVNAQGQPLKDDGTPADSVADALDAATNDLLDQGEAVHNWATTYKVGVGRTAIPGVYDVDPRQTALYAPYVGWTAQNTARADGRP